MDLNNLVTIEVDVLIDKNDIKDKYTRLRFNICNHIDELNIKNTYIIPIDPKGVNLPIKNFILLIQNGKYTEHLKLCWSESKIPIHFNKIQLRFITEKGIIDTNIIDVS